MPIPGFGVNTGPCNNVKTFESRLEKLAKKYDKNPDKIGPQIQKLFENNSEHKQPGEKFLNNNNYSAIKDLVSERKTTEASGHIFGDIRDPDSASSSSRGLSRSDLDPADSSLKEEVDDSVEIGPLIEGVREDVANTVTQTLSHLKVNEAKRAVLEMESLVKDLVNEEKSIILGALGGKDGASTYLILEEAKPLLDLTNNFDKKVTILLALHSCKNKAEAQKIIRGAISKANQGKKEKEIFSEINKFGQELRLDIAKEDFEKAGISTPTREEIKALALTDSSNLELAKDIDKIFSNEKREKYNKKEGEVLLKILKEIPREKRFSVISQAARLITDSTNKKNKAFLLQKLGRTQSDDLGAVVDTVLSVTKDESKIFKYIQSLSRYDADLLKSTLKQLSQLNKKSIGNETKEDLKRFLTKKVGRRNLEKGLEKLSGLMEEISDLEKEGVRESISSIKIRGDGLVKGGALSAAADMTLALIKNVTSGKDKVFAKVYEVYNNYWVGRNFESMKDIAVSLSKNVSSGEGVASIVGKLAALVPQQGGWPGLDSDEQKTALSTAKDFLEDLTNGQEIANIWYEIAQHKTSDFKEFNRGNGTIDTYIGCAKTILEDFKDIKGLSEGEKRAAALKAAFNFLNTTKGNAKLSEKLLEEMFGSDSWKNANTINEKVEAISDFAEKNR